MKKRLQTIRPCPAQRFAGRRSANSGDLDLSEIGGPTGLGLYTLDEGVKKYQTRNGLDVDGWLKPGGPTITKMKEQLGGLLSGYPAPPSAPC